MHTVLFRVAGVSRISHTKENSMKTRNALMVAVAVLGMALLADGEAFARGGQGGGSGSSYRGSQSTTTRPEGSQRRDGTFNTTGTTANGSTTRPSNGRGVMDGTGVNATTTTTTTVAQ